MRHVSEIIAADLDIDGLCLRTTGRTLAEWDAEWSRRRVNGLLSRRLNGHSLYTADDRDLECGYYGLDDTDFEPVVAKTFEQPVLLPEEYRSMPLVTLDPMEAEGHIARHVMNWKHTGECPPLKVVLLYRIRQAALSRIADEPRPRQAA